MKLTHVFSVALLASCQTVQTSFASGPIPPATRDITVSTEGSNRTSYFSLLSAVAESTTS